MNFNARPPILQTRQIGVARSLAVIVQKKAPETFIDAFIKEEPH
jgi:hypothetical protein